MGSKEGLPSKTLALSVIFENVLYVISAFLLSLLSLSIAFGSRLSGFYYLIGAVVVLLGLLVMHPKVFYPCLNLFLRKIKKNEIDPSLSLNYKEIIEIIFYNSAAFILFGIGFFFLINSIVYLSWQNILGVVGIFTFASIIGSIAAFVPSGLGVREGILAGLLNLYFPLGLAVLISLVGRLWATASELLLLGLVYLVNYGKKC